MKLSITSDKIMSLAWCLVLAYAAFLIPVDALAQTLTVGVGTSGSSGTSGNVSGNSTVLGGLLCGVAKWFTGSVGKGIATLAIIVIGIGALMGKVSWGMAIIVGLGVAVIFGAPVIVNELGGTGNC